MTSLQDLPTAKARFIEPMKAKLVEEPPATGDWIYELKFDGIRLIGVKKDDKVLLLSRNENELTRRFPEIVEAIKTLPARECVIDGEVVALDEEGKVFVSTVAGARDGRAEDPVYFYAFDLLQLDGKSLLSLPLEPRKNILEKLCVARGDPIRYSGAIGGDAKRLLDEVKRRVLKESSGNSATLFTSLDAEAALDQTQDASASRNSSSVDTHRHRDHEIFWRDPGWLLREQKTRVCREGLAPGSLQNRYPCSTRNSKRKHATIARLSIYHQSKMGMGTGHHALDDAENALGKSGFRL